MPLAARGRSLHVEFLVRLLGCLYDRLAESALADPVDADNLRVVGARRKSRKSEREQEVRRREKEHREGSREQRGERLW